MLHNMVWIIIVSGTPDRKLRSFTVDQKNLACLQQFDLRESFLEVWRVFQILRTEHSCRSLRAWGRHLGLINFTRILTLDYSNMRA